MIEKMIRTWLVSHAYVLEKSISQIYENILEIHSQ